MNKQQVNELVLQSLEQEIGGIQVYETALKCAINEDLRDEWKKYLEQTRNHERILRGVCKALDVDAAKETPGRTILRSLGGALVDAMETALAAGKREAAELVACECVVLAETKDHFDWELIGKCAENLEGEAAKVLAAAYKEVEDQEDEHVYHTKGWCRELWLQSLGLKAVLPPPEERQHVKTAIGAAKAEQARETMS
jgi:rubrerythrin